MQLAELASIFRQGLTMLDTTLHNPALNFYIHSLPTTSEGADYYHWHLEIAPRVSKYGGFEIGGGTIIDIVSPEQAAGFLTGKTQDNAA
jgi:UDPglucose--hexose-1-phosphate uridylyltransferase